jgi:hypothetical protein
MTAGMFSIGKTKPDKQIIGIRNRTSSRHHGLAAASRKLSTRRGPGRGAHHVETGHGDEQPQPTRGT